MATINHRSTQPIVETSFFGFSLNKDVGENVSVDGISRKTSSSYIKS